jgi:hypothetical protein
LNRPQVDDEVRQTVQNCGDDVENVSVNAVIGLDSCLPVGFSWANDLLVYEAIRIVEGRTYRHWSIVTQTVLIA